MIDAEINLAIAKIEFAGKELFQCGDHVDVRLGAGITLVLITATTGQT